jgi:Recombinase zinc beta ribbon domain
LAESSRTRGLLVCGRCRGRYHTRTTHGLRYYRCRRKADRLEAIRCAARVIRADMLDALVWETVVGVLQQPEVLLAKLEAHRVTLGGRVVEVRSAIGHLRRELAEVERRERRLLALYLDEELASLSGLKDESDALAKRKAGVRERLAASEAAVAAVQSRRVHAPRLCAPARRRSGASSAWTLTGDGPSSACSSTRS